LLPNRTLKATPANPKLLAAAALRNDPPEVPSRAHAVAQKVGTFQSVSALRFAGGSSDALVSDGAANAAYLIQNASGAAQTTALGSAQDGLSRPVAIEAMDARRVLVANAGANKLTILYRDGTPALSISCGCSPVVLYQLSGSSVYRLIFGEAVRLIVAGVAVGLAGSVAAAMLMRKLLFGVQAWDAPTLLAVALVLAISALLASYIPARRAASVNPTEALRAE